MRKVRAFLALNSLLPLFSSPALGSSCQEELGPKLSQTYYLWVPSPMANRSNPKAELPPVYRRLIEKLQPGGVLIGDSNELSGKTIEEMGALTDQIKSLYRADSPTPLIGADYLSVYRNELKFPEDFQELGFGTHLLNDISTSLVQASDDFAKVCLEIVSSIKAIAHRVVGINHPLGPIVEEQIDRNNPTPRTSTETPKRLTVALQKEGIIPTLKHFPFLVQSEDPHLGLTSSNVTPKLARELQNNFFVSSEKDYVVMTTHVSSPQVDGGKIVTFSSEWVGNLRKELKDTNLIMTDGLFMLGAYPEQIAQASRHSKEKLATYFLTRGSITYKPYNYIHDPCFRALKPLLKTNRGTRSAQLRKVADALYEKTSSELKNRCNTVVERYLSFIQPGFDPDEAEKIGTEVISSFVEKSLLAGHDLDILEGYPQVAEAAHEILVKKACSPGGQSLKERIDAAANRIQGFKRRNQAALRERASTEWINSHRNQLEELIFEVYPALNDPQAQCNAPSLSRAQELFRELCR